MAADSWPARWWRSSRDNAIRSWSILAVVLATIANVVQVLTAGELSTTGIVIGGVVLVLALIGFSFHAGRASARRADDEAAVDSRELDTVRTIIEGTFGAHRPYEDERTIIFDIGLTPEGDRVEERHTTAPTHGPVLYWCLFEALTRGPDQALTARAIKLNVTRTPETQAVPQRANVISLESAVPRALVVFAPPRPHVSWQAHYASPGYWDQLRQKGQIQMFEWVPPSVGPYDTTNRRTPVRKVTFVFSVPARLGTLHFVGLPDSVTLSVNPPMTATDVTVREYTCEIADLRAAITLTNGSIAPLMWHLQLEVGGPMS